MDFKTASQIIKSRWSDLYPADGNGRGKGIICPICGSGSGEHGTGISLYKRSSNYFLKCWNGACSFNNGGSVIDLYMMEHTGITFPAAVDALAGELGIVIDSAADDFAPVTAAHKPAEAKPIEMVQTADFTDYYRSCAERLQNSPEAISYLQQRGLSLDTVRPFFIGYDPAADPASAPGAADGEYKPHPCARIIIPTTQAHYVGRSIDPSTDKKYTKMNPAESKGAGKPGIFNQRALWGDAQTVFVVEGAFDALSVQEVGAAAIALNSTSNVDLLLKALADQPTKATLVLCLDNDAAGKGAQEKLQEGLRGLNIVYCVGNICAGHKDPNEALQKDRAAFAAAVEAAQGKQAAKPDNVAEYLKHALAEDVRKFSTAGRVKTGFSNLDSKLPLGIFPGLYAIASGTSMGKTTFAWQLADQIAAAGKDVIYFSMEQSRLEMVTKSLARMAYITEKQNGTAENACTALQIRNGSLPESVLQAAEQFAEGAGKNLSVVEGNFNCDIGYIEEYARNYIARNDVRPVLFVDYLQILQPTAKGKAERQQKREAIDEAVTQLRRLARELDLIIFVISSINRANYAQEFSMESLKESGGIEYTADSVFGLQLACFDDAAFADEKKNIQEKRKQIRAAKAEMPRRIKFIAEKNRAGMATFEAYFLYYPKYDLFTPDPAAMAASDAQKPQQRKRL